MWTTPKILYLVNLTGVPDHIRKGPDVGEIEGIVDKEGEIVAYWACNDGSMCNSMLSEIAQYFGHVTDIATDEQTKQFQEILWNQAIKDYDLEDAVIEEDEDEDEIEGTDD